MDGRRAYLRTFFFSFFFEFFAFNGKKLLLTFKISLGSEGWREADE